MTGAMPLVDFLRARYVEDETRAQGLMRIAQDTQLTVQGPSWLGRKVPGWHAWPDVETICQATLADIAAKRAILDLHRQVECSTCQAKGRRPGTSCVRCHHGEPDFGERFYNGTCSTTLALSQAYRDHPEWDELELDSD